MRILQVVTLISPDGAYGGPARVALNQCAALRAAGVDPLLTGATRGYSTAPSEVDGVRVRLFPSRTLLPRTGFAGLGAPELYRWFSRHRNGFDLVHIHLGRDLVALPVAVAARRYRIPYVLQTHGMVTRSKHPLARPLDAAWTRRVLRDAGTVFYLTSNERDELISVGGTRLRLTHLGNGVPQYHRATSDTAVPEVLFAARLQQRKCPTAFVHMARTLLEAGVEARFTLVGPDEGEGAAVLEAIGSDPRIRWEGALDSAQVPHRMAAACVFVLPSVREQYPMAVLEAMAVGIPVVVSDDCGLAATVVRARCGIATSPTPSSMAGAVRSLLADPTVAAEMGARGRSVAHRDFGMNAVVRQLSDTYTDVIADRS